ncbi:MAG: VOC family protein [Pseudomonadales bacterium]|nr:VOC family protein [Pseudomonadales bacterium]
MKTLSANTILYCLKWRETVGFYQDKLGFPVALAKDWFVEFKTAETSFLSIANADRATIETNAGRGVTLSFRVEDLSVLHARLLAQKLKPTGIFMHAWGSPVFYIHDPEGNRLEFWSAVING